MKDIIQIPTDFKSLHDLRELTKNYNVMVKLHNALNNYQDAYIESFIMSFKEVISYIPEKQLMKYEIFDMIYSDFVKDKIIYNNWLKNDDKVFMIDHKHKKIIQCEWLTNNHYDTYTNTEYTIDSEKYLLFLKKEFTFEKQQIIGGVWINGRGPRGYISGNYKRNYLKLNGHIIYKFCTNTNQFLGIDSEYREEYEDWIEMN